MRFWAKKLSDYYSSGVQTAFVFVSGNLLAAILSGLSSLLIGRYVEASVLGDFSRFAIPGTYMALGIYFVDAAFQRHYMVHTGRQEFGLALEYASVAKWWSLCTSLICTFIFTVLAARSIWLGDFRVSLTWISQIPAYWVLNYVVFLKVLYRTNDDFRRLSTNSVVTALVGVITVFPVLISQYLGLVWRTIALNTVLVYTHARYSPKRVKAKFDRNKLYELFRISLPIQIPVYLDTAFMQATISWLIVDRIGKDALGIYLFAITIQGMVVLVSNSFNQILTTKLMLYYGRENNFKKTIIYGINIAFPVLLLSLFILLVFNIFLPDIFLVFPKYLASIPLVRWLSIESVIVILRLPLNVFFASLMIREMAVLRLSKVLITLTLLFTTFYNLLGLVKIIVFVSLLNVAHSYYILFKRTNG